MYVQTEESSHKEEMLNMMGQYGIADMDTDTGAYLDGTGMTTKELVQEEYNMYKRSPKWELDAIWKALHLMTFLNGPREDARIRAIIIIRAERKNG